MPSYWDEDGKLVDMRVEVVKGNLQLAGSNVEDGSPVSGVSFVLDENNHPVLRIVDAAPFAYDKTTDTIKISHQKEEIVVWSNLQIRDTATTFSPVFDLSKYRKVIFWIRNNHDQDLQLRYKPGTPTLGNEIAFNGSESVNFKAISKHGYMIDLSKVFPDISSEGVFNIAFEIKSSTAPTTGDVKLVGVGVY